LSFPHHAASSPERRHTSGQDAEIKVDTFTFTRYGLLHGKVLSVSRDAITRDKPQDKPNEKGAPGADNASSELKGQELSYAARVSLDRMQMQIDDNLDEEKEAPQQRRDRTLSVLSRRINHTPAAQAAVNTIALISKLPSAASVHPARLIA
jgi:hypothetical protein